MRQPKARYMCILSISSAFTFDYSTPCKLTSAAPGQSLDYYIIFTQVQGLYMKKVVLRRFALYGVTTVLPLSAATSGVVQSTAFSSGVDVGSTSVLACVSSLPALAVCVSGLTGSVMPAGKDKVADVETEVVVVLVEVCCAGAGEPNNATGDSRIGDNGGGLAADALRQD